MEKFSVLTSVYKKDKPEQLKLSLSSIYQNQTVKPNEIVLVIDGPISDELKNVIEEFEKDCPVLKVVKQEENMGLGKTLNNGLEHCSNDIVARMDADDVSMPERFEEQLKVIAEGYDLIGSNLKEFIDNPDEVVSERIVPEKQEDIIKFMKGRNPFSHPTVMFRKEMVLKAGGYQHLHYCEDYYLWVRMYLAGAKMYNIQKPLLRFRMNMDTYGRRGGYKYFCSHKQLFKFMRKNKVMGYFTYLKNIHIRFFAEVMLSNKKRQKLYQKHLRKEIKNDKGQNSDKEAV